MLTELNPNHEVTQSMREQWAKIVVMLMLRDGVTETVIPLNVIEDAVTQRELNLTVRISDTRGIVLKLVDNAEAARLAREEGGLPA